MKNYKLFIEYHVTIIVGQLYCSLFETLWFFAWYLTFNLLASIWKLSQIVLRWYLLSYTREISNHSNCLFITIKLIFCDCTSISISYDFCNIDFWRSLLNVLNKIKAVSKYYLYFICSFNCSNRAKSAHVKMIWHLDLLLGKLKIVDFAQVILLGFFLEWRLL